MRNMLAAVLIVLMMSFAAGNASAMMCGCGKEMMDGKGKGGGEKGMMMKGEDMARHFMMMVEMLGLNAEQQKAVEAIHYTHRKEVIRKAADIDVAEIELQEIMGKEPVKMEDAEKKVRTISGLQADLDIMHLKAKAAFKAKLTPEQLEKMKKHMEAGMSGKMEDMGGMCMGCGKMACKSMKCEMMGSASARAKASDADAASKDTKSEEKKAEPSSHH